MSLLSTVKPVFLKMFFNHVHESKNYEYASTCFLVAGALFSGMLGYYILSIDSPVDIFLEVFLI